MRTKISPAQAPAQPLGVPKPSKALSNHLWNALGMVLAGLAFVLAVAVRAGSLFYPAKAMAMRPFLC